MFIRLVILSLTGLAVIMGIHYLNRQYGIGPGLPALPDAWFAQVKPTPPPTVVPAGTAATDTSQERLRRSLAGTLVVPVLVNEEGLDPAGLSLTYLGKLQPLMVVLQGSEVPATAAATVISQLKALPNPPLIAVNHEGGRVQTLSGEGFTQLPSWQQQCAQSAAVRAEAAASSAAELARVGVEVVFGPVVDRAAGGRLRDRTCAANTDTIITAASEQITAYQASGLTPVLMHYPGLGALGVDLSAQPAAATITETDVLPFERLLTARPGLPVLVSYLRITPADPDTPCALSYLCVGSINQVFPDALLIADAVDQPAAGYLATSSAVQRPLGARAGLALKAGVNALMFGPTVTEQELEQALDAIVEEVTILDIVDKRVSQRLEQTRDWKTSTAAFFRSKQTNGQ